MRLPPSPRDTHPAAAIGLLAVFVLTLASAISLYTQTWHGLWIAAAAIAALALTGLGVEGWSRVALRRRPSWRCTQCGYDRRGLRKDQPCPECGQRVSSPRYHGEDA